MTLILLTTANEPMTCKISVTINGEVAEVDLPLVRREGVVAVGSVTYSQLVALAGMKGWPEVFYRVPGGRRGRLVTPEDPAWLVAGSEISVR